MQEPKKPKAGIIALIVIVLLAVAAGAVYFATRPNESDTSSQQTTQEATTTTESTTSGTSETTTNANTVAYKNGTYEATGSYSTPGGRESIDLTVVIENGVITSTKASGSATSGNSEQYQTQFLNNYETLVVGKNVDEVSLSRVAGSSLTSNGFNTALTQIKQDAAA